MKLDIRLKPGERGFIVGQTGSGKSYGAAFMLRYSPQRVIALDTKHEPLFEHIANGDDKTVVVHSRDEMLDAYKQKTGAEYIIVRPPAAELSDPELLDAYLQDIYESCRDVLTFVDELYMFHQGSRAFPGLIGLLTRGRARALTTLMATQRPAWVSRFALTESQRFYIFRLSDRRDWKTLASIGPFEEWETKPIPKFHYLYWRQGEDDAPRLMAPLPQIADLGYTPQAETGTKNKWV